MTTAALKQVLVKHFCHSLAFHSSGFCAVAVITELNIEAGESLFPVEYTDKGQKMTVDVSFS
jgi:hypothetical protein